MTKRPSDTVTNGGSEDESQSADHKRPRTFMATLACSACRSRKTRCDEDRPRCGYCKMTDAACIYPEPRTTKKDQSMSVAINAIRRLEAKVEELSAAFHSSRRAPTEVFDHPSVQSMVATPPVHHSALHQLSSIALREHGRVHDMAPSPSVRGTPKSTYETPGVIGQTPLSFSQHGVALWPAIRHLLPSEFVTARDALPKDFVVEFESQRQLLPMTINSPFGPYSERWLTELPLSVIKGLIDAYFAVFNRIMPVVDKHHFSTTLGAALGTEFGYDIETCLLLSVLALGCLAVKAFEEGNFPLPSRFAAAADDRVFERPGWYELVTEDPAGLMFFNEARKRFGFLMCQNDVQTCQFYMLSTHYYAQILRPIDSWTMVNRAASCCMSLLKRTEFDFDTWEGDMMSRVFWSTLMYETILIQELNLPLSVLQEYEANVPIPKFTPYPRSTPKIGELPDDDEGFFNFHFLAQAAHRIILTRIRHNLYFFSEKESFPPPSLVAEMHHQLEQWRRNLPPAIRFTDHETRVLPSPAHVIADAMLRSRYFVAKFHIARPILYKVLHAPMLATEMDYREVRNGLKSGMYWPATIGLCSQMASAQPLKFGWSCQCFGQALLFHAVARSPDPKLRETLPIGWQDWVQTMMGLIDHCGNYSPALRKDAALLRTLWDSASDINP